MSPNYYVPVLKVKRGEKDSLRAVASHLRQRITPLLEIVERESTKSSTIDEHLKTAFKNLSESVWSYPRCFIDVREIAPDGPGAAEKVFQRAANLGMIFVPVTGISRTVDVKAALDNSHHGIALRLTRDEFEQINLLRAINKFLRTYSIVPEQVDLIVDLGAINEMISPGIIALTNLFLEAVPYHNRWKTFTVSACAFPEHMGFVERHSHAFQEREEWIAWRDGLYFRRNEIPRLPTFSDCVIQHPKGVEGFDFRIMQVSATIRYTMPEKWLFIKGESTKKTLPSEQFPSLATQLAYGHLIRHYKGPDHCKGCFSIKSAADGGKGLGSAEAWRRIGTIHHITTVMDQLLSLP